MTLIYNRSVFQMVDQEGKEESRLNIDLQDFEIHLILNPENPGNPTNSGSDKGWPGFDWGWPWNGHNLYFPAIPSICSVDRFTRACAGGRSSSSLPPRKRRQKNEKNDFANKPIIDWLFICRNCTSYISVDTYTVSSSGHYQSWTDLKTLCVQRANEFCAAQKKHVSVVSTDTHGVRGWSPQEYEFTFKCLQLPPE